MMICWSVRKIFLSQAQILKPPAWFFQWQVVVIISILAVLTTIVSAQDSIQTGESMMKSKSVFLILFTGLLLVNCSVSDEAGQAVTAPSGNQVISPDGSLTGTPMTRDEVRQKILEEIDTQGYYDVIVTDVDGWNIRLWQVRHRANRDVVTYRGNMAYYSGVNYYEGTAAGIWDYENNIFSCTCLDSSWNGGHINYVMPFVGYSSENVVTLKGPYYYLENPNRVNRIYAWVFEGGFPYINPASAAKQRAPRSAEEIADYLSQGDARHKMPIED